MSAAKHSPLPWSSSTPISGLVDIFCARDKCLFSLAGDDMKAEQRQAEADGAFVVLAVNSHYEMLAALRSVLAKRGGTMALTATDPRVVAIHAAIARAEGKA